MGSLFSPPSAPQMPQIPMPPTPPPPKEPVVMPQPDPLAQKNAETKKAAQARARSTTRASTILGDDEGLGG